MKTDKNLKQLKELATTREFKFKQAVKIIETKEMGTEQERCDGQRTVLETLKDMREETPSPDRMQMVRENEEIVKQLQAKVDVYMSAEDTNDISAVSFFKGLQENEVLE